MKYYICFVYLHSFWCDFWRFNPAISTAPAKFALTACGGTKWQETLEKINIFVVNLLCVFLPFCFVVCTIQ